MKKLLFVAGSLRIGGIEKSLVNLLKNIDYSKFDVDLYLYANQGEYLDEIPKEVKLVNSSKLLNILGLTMQEAKNQKNLYTFFVRSLSAFICNKIGSFNFWNLVFKTIPKLSGYDAAIAFSNNVNNKSLYSGFYQFILTRVESKNKIGWVHSDYKAMGIKSDDDRVFFEELDKIVNVSFACKDVFDDIFPEYKEKSFVVYNTVPIDEVKLLSLENPVIPYKKSNQNSFLGVTVARLDKNKSVDRVVRTVGRLRKLGLDIKWTIVGDGPERGALEELAVHCGIESYISFEGMKPNPYPYIKQADILVLSSKYEGLPMTVAESLVIGTPTLVTRYAAAEEQVNHGYNGIIVENSEEEIYVALKELFLQPEKLQKLKENIAKEKINNNNAMKQFEYIINENNLQ